MCQSTSARCIWTVARVGMNAHAYVLGVPHRGLTGARFLRIQGILEISSVRRQGTCSVGRSVTLVTGWCGLEVCSSGATIRWWPRGE